MQQTLAGYNVTCGHTRGNCTPFKMAESKQTKIEYTQMDDEQFTRSREWIVH